MTPEEITALGIVIENANESGDRRVQASASILTALLVREAGEGL